MTDQQRPVGGWPDVPPRGDGPQWPDAATSSGGHWNGVPDPPGADQWAAPGAVAPSGGDGGSSPPSNLSDAKPGGARPIALVALGVIVVLCLLGGLFGLVSVARRDDGSTDLGTPPPRSTPSSVPATEPPPSATEPAPGSTVAPPTTQPVVPANPLSAEELAALVAELKVFVEQARGLDFITDVDVELVDDAEFTRRLLSDFDESIDDLDKAELSYRALGLLDGETSLADLLRDLLGVGVLGFYDPEIDELVVRGVEATAYVRSTIVHELVHALDDQHFDLDRPEYDDRPDEIATGFSAIVEGNARAVENEWVDAQSQEIKDELREEQAEVVEGVDFSRFPEFIVTQLLAPYELGERLISAIEARNGERGVDAALSTPPETSEQVLFADKYFGAEARIDVPPPAVDGEVVDDGVVGALFWFVLFTSGDSPVNASDAIRAVQGWGGDWAVTYLVEDVPCLHADVVADTPSDLDEFEQSIDLWASVRDDADVSRSDGRVRLDTCAPPSGAENPDI